MPQTEQTPTAPTTSNQTLTAPTICPNLLLAQYQEKVAQAAIFAGALQALGRLGHNAAVPHPVAVTVDGTYWHYDGRWTASVYVIGGTWAFYASSIPDPDQTKSFLEHVSNTDASWLTVAEKFFAHVKALSCA